eukprot:976479-Amorphochlora_amoeboformis.AAC.1
MQYDTRPTSCLPNVIPFSTYTQVPRMKDVILQKETDGETAFRDPSTMPTPVNDMKGNTPVPLPASVPVPSLPSAKLTTAEANIGSVVSDAGPDDPHPYGRPHDGEEYGRPQYHQQTEIANHNGDSKAFNAGLSKTPISSSIKAPNADGKKSDSVPDLPTNKPAPRRKKKKRITKVSSLCAQFETLSESERIPSPSTTISLASFGQTSQR